jgi:V8-like Glu-specific endopeptidase
MSQLLLLSFPEMQIIISYMNIYKLLWIGLVFPFVGFSQAIPNLSDHPHFLVAKLYMKIGSSVYNGTGFIIKDSFLITNAHNVYDKDSLIVIPAYSHDTLRYQPIRVECKKNENVLIPREYEDDDLSDEYDFAIIKLPPSSTLKTIRNNPNYATVFLDSINLGEKLFIAGYPVFRWFEFRKNNGKIQYSNSTSDYNMHKNKRLINYKMNTRGGSSGSPLWVVRNGNIVLVGIHKSGQGAHNQGISYSLKQLRIIQQFTQ